MKPSAPKSKELNVCGWQAVSALFARHPDEVQRLFFDAATGRRAGEFCSLLAARKKVYRQVEPVELDKIAGSKLHGGIVAVVAERPLKKVTREVMAEWARPLPPLPPLPPLLPPSFWAIAAGRTMASTSTRATTPPNHFLESLIPKLLPRRPPRGPIDALPVTWFARRSAPSPARPRTRDLA